MILIVWRLLNKTLFVVEWFNSSSTGFRKQTSETCWNKILLDSGYLVIVRGLVVDSFKFYVLILNKQEYMISKLLEKYLCGRRSEYLFNVIFVDTLLKICQNRFVLARVFPFMDRIFDSVLIRGNTDKKKSVPWYT